MIDTAQCEVLLYIFCDLLEPFTCSQEAFCITVEKMITGRVEREL